MPSRTALTPAVAARRSLVITIVALALVALALALWKMRLAILLLFGSIVIASAMRPGVEALHRRGVPRALGVALHLAAVAVVVGVLLWFAAPRAVAQIQHAVANLPETRSHLRHEVRQSSGLKHDLLLGLERRLRHLPTASSLLGSAVELTRRAVEVIVGVFFLFAAAAYWIFERDRVEEVVLRLLPRRKRKTVSDTWQLIDLKLGAFVRGQLLLMLLVGTALSLAFWVIGEPYWLLVGSFGGIVEIVPVLGPLAAGGVAVAVGFTASWQVALGAGIVVLVLRLLEDYLVLPRVLGSAVGLSPLIVLVAVSAAGVILGGFAVVLAIPIAVLFATLVDVLVLGRDPGREQVPTVMFSAKEGETVDGR